MDILPTLRPFGGAVTEISGVRGPSGAVVFLFGTSYVCIFPVVADIISHRDGNLHLLALSYGEGWFLDDTHPTFKPGIILQCQDAFKRADGTWRDGFVKATKRIANTFRRTIACTALEYGGSSLNHTHSCVNHNHGSVRTQVSAKAGRGKSSQVEHKLALNLVTRMWRLTR